MARTPAQAAAWAIVEPLLGELRSGRHRADRNADVQLTSIPASLKAWLDQVTFPRMSLAPRRFVVATARGGAYSPGSPKAQFNYQERFLRDFVAGHYGVADTVFINAEMANARVDPALARFRSMHDDSTAQALAAALHSRQGVREMSWLVLGLAGLVEIAWSQSIKPTEGFTRPLPHDGCAVVGALSVYLLPLAMRGLPVGTAYAVFTGIGAVGAIALGVLIHRDPLSVGRALALSMIVEGSRWPGLTNPD